MKKRKKKATAKSKPLVKKPDAITFKAFFSRCVNIGLMKQREEGVIWAFMKSNGLTEKEDLDTYQKMLEKF